jgi:hypothetical protein
MNNKCLWIFFGEAMALFGKQKRSVEYAIWKDHIKARQSRVGAVWMIEYHSCVENWGKPIDENLLKEILADVNY